MKWFYLISCGIALMCSAALTAFFAHTGNPNAAWGWGVAAIGILADFFERIAEVF